MCVQFFFLSLELATSLSCHCQMIDAWLVAISLEYIVLLFFFLPAKIVCVEQSTIIMIIRVN